MRVLASYSIKGGVGKTTTTANLAYLAARAGARTLIWDLDPQGAATYCFRIKPRIKGGGRKLVCGKRPLDRRIRGTDFENLDLLAADFSYRNLDLALDGAKRPHKRLADKLRPLEERYDYVFLDCAPSISLVSGAIFSAADALLIPTVPTTLSMRMVRRLAKHLAGEKADPRVFPFFCMVDRRKALHREVCRNTVTAPYTILSTSIPYASVVEQMSVRRAPLETFAKASAAARAYVHLWAEIESCLDGNRR